jgi:two-component system LytT family response regulator
MQLQKIKSVIVEDEDAARAALKSYLDKYCPQIELIGEAKNAKEGIEIINNLKPQLVFLDVEMPYGNAFDVLEQTKNHHYETIFATAFSEYSLKALNQSAAYYLLKPINIEELILSVNKVQQQINTNELLNRNKIIVENFNQPSYDQQKIILPTLEGFEVAKVSNISRLKGNGNFTDIYFNDGSKKMICRFLKHFDELLSIPFIRVHKSHIININYVKSYNKGGYIILLDSSEIELSATYKAHFLEAFGKS